MVFQLDEYDSTSLPTEVEEAGKNFAVISTLLDNGSSEKTANVSLAKHEEYDVERAMSPVSSASEGSEETWIGFTTESYTFADFDGQYLEVAELNDDLNADFDDTTLQDFEPLTRKENKSEVLELHGIDINQRPQSRHGLGNKSHNDGANSTTETIPESPNDVDFDILHVRPPRALILVNPDGRQKKLATFDRDSIEPTILVIQSRIEKLTHKYSEESLLFKLKVQIESLSESINEARFKYEEDIAALEDRVKRRDSELLKLSKQWNDGVNEFNHLSGREEKATKEAKLFKEREASAVKKLEDSVEVLGREMEIAEELRKELAEVRSKLKEADALLQALRLERSQAEETESGQSQITAANAKIKELQKQIEEILAQTHSRNSTPSKEENEEILISLDSTSNFSPELTDPDSLTPFKWRELRMMEEQKERLNTDLHIASLQSQISTQERQSASQQAQSKKDALTIKLQSRQIKALQGDIEYMATGTPNNAMGQIMTQSMLSSLAIRNGKVIERDPVRREEKYVKKRKEKALELEKRGEEHMARMKGHIETLRSAGLRGLDGLVVDDEFVRGLFKRQVPKRPSVQHWKAG
jgi:hypothetical protein